MTGRAGRTAGWVTAVAAGLLAVGLRPRGASADRGDRPAAADGKVGYVHLPRVLGESARGKAHARLLGDLRDRQLAALTAARAGGPAAQAAAQADAQKAFDAQAERLLGEMYREIAVVAAGLARELGLDAVQTYPVPPGTIDVRQMRGVIEAPAALLYVRPDADLTADVIRRLDQRYDGSE